MATGPKILYEFGPFRLDPEKQLLLREEQPVAVTPKTLETLVVLVRRSREVVSKDELMKELWPDSFVEESNLSQNIFMLRKALGETPDDRRYIVTLPGKGYRFAAEVRTITEGGDDLIVASHSRSQLVVEHRETGSDTLPALTGEKERRSLWRYALALVLVGLVVAAAFFLRKPRTLAAGGKGSILIAEFANTTNDPVFDGTLRQGLAVQLGQSPYLSLVSEDRIRQTLRLMNQKPDVVLMPELAREVCERIGAAAVLDGSISQLGTRYILGLRATDCHTGEVIAREQVQIANKEEVLNALTQLAGNIRQPLGESLSTLERYNVPLQQMTTSSLDALKAYSAGMHYSVTSGFAEALPQLKRAVELDPQFAAAYAALGLTYSALGESALAVENTTKAYELRNRASDREKFFITTLYYRDVTGNLEKEVETLRLWAQVYPHDRDAHGLLSGFASQGLGQYDQAIGEGNLALTIDPDFAVAYVNIAFSQLYLNRVAEATKTVDHAFQQKFESPELHLLQYQLAFLHDDKVDMDRAVAEAQGKSGVQDWMWHAEALVAARSGKLQLARSLARQAMEEAQQAGDSERAATYEAALAASEALLGNDAAARQSAYSALHIANGRDLEYAAAFALALAGDIARAQQIAADLEKRFPEDTSVRFNYLPTLHALIALQQHGPIKALDILQVNAPYETAVSALAFNQFFGALYPTYTRGQAYLALGRGREAAAEFNKILHCRGLLLGDPVGALARLGMARAYVAAGDTVAGRKEYEDLLALWKDADSDIPIYRQAKAEYAKLP